VTRSKVKTAKISNEYDLQGLVDKLAEIEPDFSDAADEARAKREAAARPGMRRRRPSSTSAEAEA